MSEHERKQREYQDALAGFDRVSYLTEQLQAAQAEIAALKAARGPCVDHEQQFDEQCESCHWTHVVSNRFRNEIAALKADIADLLPMRDADAFTITNLNREIAARDARLADMQKGNERLNRIIETQGARVRELEAEIAARDARIAEVEGDREMYRRCMLDSGTRIEELSARVRELEIEFEDHNGCADELADALRCAEVRVRELEAFISDRAYVNDHSGLDRCVECQHVYGHGSKCSIGAVLASASATTDPAPGGNEKG